MSFFKQPKAVYLLSFVELWSRFSQFGMRTLLVLFMVNALQFTDAAAFGVFAVFGALEKLSGLLGSFVASRALGLKRAVFLGGWIMALGHFVLTLKCFFPGLALLVVGSGLFTTNIMALISHFYAQGERERTSGCTLFYMSINVGALLATILCGMIASKYGWEYGFGLAAVGMVIGNLTLMKYGYLLRGKGERPQKVPHIYRKALAPVLVCAGLCVCAFLLLENIVLLFLPWVVLGAFFLIVRTLLRKNISFFTFGVPLVAYIIFTLAETQIASSLVVLAARISSPIVLGIAMTPTSILVINPVVIIVLGVLAAVLHRKFAHTYLQMFFPFALTALAFCVPAFFTHLPLSGLMGVVALISFAEIFVIPQVFSAMSRVTVRANEPVVMTLIPLGYAIASLAGGGMGKFIAHNGYGLGFGLLAGFLLLCGMGFGFAQKLHFREQELKV